MIDSLKEKSCSSTKELLNILISSYLKQLADTSHSYVYIYHMSVSDKKCILIVEDDPATLEVLILMIKHFGFNVVTARNKSEFDLIEEQPDLFILDNWIAGAFGHDICINLKKNPATACIPVILLSAARDLDTIANSCGADIFMNKPFDIDELLLNIQSLISPVKNM